MHPSNRSIGPELVSVVGLLGLGVLAACAHAGAPPASGAPRAPKQHERATAPAQSTASTAPVERKAEQVEKTAKPEASPTPPTIKDYMEAHFVITTWSRDAVINGSLDALREPLLAMADFDYGRVAPGDWMAQIVALQATARVTAGAESLEAAAIGVATMARQCGDCHTEKRHKLYFGPDIRTTERPPEASLRERMERHVWAADRMWEGLTGPSDNAWNAGAAALAAVPLASPDSDVVLSAAFKKRLRDMRTVGTKALAAESRAERADVYASLLVSCADCHSQAEELEF